MIPTTDFYAGITIAIAFLMLLALAEFLRSWAQWSVEWTRKLVHFGGGLVCLGFPYFIQSQWVVLALAISLGAIFLVSRQLRLLSSVHCIQRQSHGVEYYPLVIYLLFLLAADQPWIYMICVLVLSVSDAVAALVGTRFGRIRYRVEEETKSVEGSLAFFAATFVVVLVPLILLRPQFDSLHVPYWHYVLAANLIGLLVTCFEAVSGRGRDNLFIPLGTYLVLSKTFQTDVWDLAMQNFSFALILIVLIGLSRYSRSFQTGGAIVICLASYGCWAMGSFDWALPVFLGYGLYVVAALTTDLPWRLSIRPVVFNVLPPFLILAAGNLALNQGHPEWMQFCFGPFLASCVVALAEAVVNAVNWRHPGPESRRWIHGLLAGIGCSLLLVIPSAIRLVMQDWLTIAGLVGVSATISAVSSRVLPAISPAVASWRWYGARMGIATLAAIVIALLQWQRLSQVWFV